MTKSPSRPLEAYLNDHLAAATAGVRLFDAARATWRGTAHAGTLDDLRQQIAADRQEVAALIGALGLEPHKLKLAVAQVGAQVSKVNPLNPLRSRRAIAGQLELEVLQSAVRGKECLWETLLALAPAEPRLDAGRLRELRDLARRQQERIAAIMTATAPDRFPAAER
jgi:hypothetical protein